MLAHEIAHRAGRDPLRKLVSRVACALYWFHPLVWLVQRQATNDCEQACDRTVLALGARPSTYARVLLEFADAAPLRVAGAMAPIVRRAHLEERLMASLHRPRVQPQPAATRPPGRHGRADTHARGGSAGEAVEARRPISSLWALRPNASDDVCRAHQTSRGRDPEHRSRDRTYDADARLRIVEQELADFNVEARVAEVEQQIRDFDLAARTAAVERQIAELDVERRVQAIENDIRALDVPRRSRELEQPRDAAHARLRDVLR